MRARQGDLAGAGVAFEEAVSWYERIAGVYGEPCVDPGELAYLRSKVEDSGQPSPPAPAPPR